MFLYGDYFNFIPGAWTLYCISLPCNLLGNFPTNLLYTDDEASIYCHILVFNYHQQTDVAAVLFYIRRENNIELIKNELL